MISYSTHTNDFNNVWASGVFFWVIKLDNISCYFMHHGRERACISSVSPSPSACLRFLDQYHPVFFYQPDMAPQYSARPTMGVCVRLILHVSPGSCNIIWAYSFHLEQKPNLYAPKNRASCFSFLSRTHYTLHRPEHYWPLLQSLRALV